jgi:hypothetical protein
MKTYTLLIVVLLLFIGCKHFESRHSLRKPSGVCSTTECVEIDELAEPILRPCDASIRFSTTFLARIIRDYGARQCDFASMMRTEAVLRNLQ